MSSRLPKALFMLSLSAGAPLAVSADAHAQDAASCGWLTQNLRFDFYAGSTNTTANIGNVDMCSIGSRMSPCTLSLNDETYSVFLEGGTVAPNKLFRWKIQNRDIQITVEGTCEAGDSKVIGLRWYSEGAQVHGSKSNQLRAEARLTGS